MKRKNVFWLVSLIIILCIGIIVLVNKTIYNQENIKSPKGSLPASEMVINKLDEYTAEWYHEISSIMVDDEKATDLDVVQEYVVANSLSLCGIEYINIKFFADETSELAYKYYNSEFKSKGEMTINETILLTKEQGEQVLKIFDSNNFWEIPSKHPEEHLGFDGNTIFIEGVNDNKYNIISMWCPDDKYEIKKIYNEIIHLVDSLGVKTFLS